MAGSLAELDGLIDEWFLASLHGPRAATADQLATALAAAGARRSPLPAWGCLRRRLGRIESRRYGHCVRLVLHCRRRAGSGRGLSRSLPGSVNVTTGRVLHWIIPFRPSGWRGTRLRQPA